MSQFRPPAPRGPSLVSELNERSREVFRLIVETYLETGEPVGSRTLSQRLQTPLSAASIRNVMADLEMAGLLYAPHISAGRLPTDSGLRLFVDGLMEVGALGDDDRHVIEAHVGAGGRSMEELLSEATSLLSGLSHCAGLVVAPKLDVPLKHLEFVPLGGDRALVVIVTEAGAVENRVIELPRGLPPSALQEASNYLNARLRGKTLDEARAAVDSEIEARRVELDEATSRVVAAGLATWAGGTSGAPASLIVRGQSRLLDDLKAVEDLERVRLLFEDLEGKKEVMGLLELAKGAEGVRVFIGSESKLFSLSGSSLVAAPYRNANQRIVGVIGVIGPTRLNYARIVPMVDFTAKVVSRLIG